MDRILTAANFLSGSAHSPEFSSTSAVLRRIKRLIWFALVGCAALVATLETEQAFTLQLSNELALVIIVVASWATLLEIARYLHGEESRRAATAEAARLEGARLTASAMQDRIANKLSLTVGYSEFLVTDPRLPADLRENAQRAMDGARAAAEQLSELKRLTRLESDAAFQPTGTATESTTIRQARLRQLIQPRPGD